MILLLYCHSCRDTEPRTARYMAAAPNGRLAGGPRSTVGIIHRRSALSAEDVLSESKGHWVHPGATWERRLKVAGDCDRSLKLSSRNGTDRREEKEVLQCIAEM